MIVSGSDLLVLLPRLAAGGMAVVMLRDAGRLLRGQPRWLLGRYGPVLLTGWKARTWGILLILLAVGAGAFALVWRGPNEPP